MNSFFQHIKNSFTADLYSHYRNRAVLKIQISGIAANNTVTSLAHCLGNTAFQIMSLVNRMIGGLHPGNFFHMFVLIHMKKPTHNPHLPAVIHLLGLAESLNYIVTCNWNINNGFSGVLVFQLFKCKITPHKNIIFPLHFVLTNHINRHHFKFHSDLVFFRIFLVYLLNYRF